jgi:hypothetical protein
MHKRNTISELHKYFFLSRQTLRSEQKTLDFVQDRLNVLAANICEAGIEICSHDMSGTLIYMATIWIHRLVKVPTCCIKDILRNSLKNFYTIPVPTLRTYNVYTVNAEGWY